MRGYAAIGLFNPKTPINIGAALRAAWCYQAAFVAVQGTRFKRASTDTYMTHRHMPLFRVDDLREVIPYDCVPIAVELKDNAQPLATYKHPRSAFYIFGPEDGHVSNELIAACRDVVCMPTRGCMNLAATVNVLLYDRAAKDMT